MSFPSTNPERGRTGRGHGTQLQQGIDLAGDHEDLAVGADQIGGREVISPTARRSAFNVSR
jgi:hypothetical protein